MGYLSSSERTLRNLASFLLVFSFIAAVNSVIDIYYRKDDSQDNHKLYFDINSHSVGRDSSVPTTLKSILWETVFLNQLHDFPLLF